MGIINFAQDYTSYVLSLEKDKWSTRVEEEWETYPFYRPQNFFQKILRKYPLAWHLLLFWCGRFINKKPQYHVGKKIKSVRRNILRKYHQFYNTKRPQKHQFPILLLMV